MSCETKMTLSDADKIEVILRMTDEAKPKIKGETIGDNSLSTSDKIEAILRRPD